MMSGGDIQGDIGSVNDEMVGCATEPEVKSTHYVNAASMSRLTAHTFMVAACHLPRQTSRQPSYNDKSLGDASPSSLSDVVTVG